MAPFIEKQLLARRMGFKDFEEMRVDFSNRLHSEYDEKSKGKTGKEAAKLEDKFRADQKDMLAIMDLLDGVYGQGENTITSTGFAKFFRNWRTYNYLAMMGSVTIQSFNDIGSIMLRNGVFRTIQNGITPMLTDMSKLSKRDLRALNFGLESELGIISQRFMDAEGLSTSPGIFERTGDALLSVYGDLNLFNFWNASVQRLSMVTSIDKTLDTIHKIKRGEPVTKKDRTRLAHLGLREEYFDYIYRQTNRPENISDNGTRVADWTTWEPKDAFESQALRDFQAATAKDIDQTVINPSVGDRPLVSQTNIGKTFFQFKGFGFASTNKILYSSIQRRKDAEVYTGITAMLTLGAMSYATSKLLRGEEVKLDLETLALEAIDRSGVLGILMEVFDIGQTIGVIPGEGATRYKSRGLEGAILGPTGGTIVQMGNMIRKIAQTIYGDEEITTADVKRMFKLFPLQNIAYVNKLTDELTTQIGEAFNLEETREGY